VARAERRQQSRFAAHSLTAMMLWAAPYAAGAAEASVEMVIATCERALAAGYQDMDAAMCDWHVRPCEECGVAQAKTWCLPTALVPADLAREVVGSLKATNAPAAPARPEIERILRAHHPCAAQDRRHD